MKNLLITLLLALLLSGNTYAAQPDWGPYHELLKRYVAEATIKGMGINAVRYSELKNDPAFTKVITMVENFPTNSLVTHDEKLAFYINAYNILAMKVVVAHWPVDSIQDVGNWLTPVWDKPAGRLNGQEISLGELEHKILRPLGEPRIHFAIVCASLSCPDLRTEAFQVDRLDAQLNDQTASFLHNPAKGLNVVGDTAEVSQIFDWFEQDFEPVGGVKAFIKTHFPQATFNKVESDLPYDWSLNGR